MIEIVKKCLNESEIDTVNNYLLTAKFHTKENHIPLHDNLFNNNPMNFGITTYGDMGKDISYIFMKISNSIAETVSKVSGQEYGQSIVTKSYIMKFDNHKELDLGFDQNRPKDVFRGMVFWNKHIEKIIVNFTNKNLNYDLFPGDIIIFPETEGFMRKIINNTDLPIFVSDFWNAPKGQSPYPGLSYDEVAWGNPMYDKID